MIPWINLPIGPESNNKILGNDILLIMHLKYLQRCQWQRFHIWDLFQYSISSLVSTNSSTVNSLIQDAPDPKT